MLGAQQARLLQLGGEGEPVVRPDSSLSTILVKIASYRDSELPLTIRSAREQAEHPDRLRFAIVNQVGPETASQLRDLAHDPGVHVVTFDWEATRGLGWARRQTDKMAREEDFHLQIDSHMRFDPGWDTELIAQWEQLRDPRGTLSCYPAPYVYDQGHEVTHPLDIHRILPLSINDQGIPRLGHRVPARALEPTLFVSGGFQFAPATVVRALPQLSAVFVGDETAHALRLFTFGYRVYVPASIPISHLYERHTQRGDVRYFHEDAAADPALSATYAALRRRNDDVMFDILRSPRSRFLGDVRPRSEFFARAQVDSPISLATVGVPRRTSE